MQADREANPGAGVLAHLLNGATTPLAFWAAEGEASEGRRDCAPARLDAVFDGLTQAS